jgi:DNA-binding CsgD family transcriptional regulator
MGARPQRSSSSRRHRDIRIRPTRDPGEPAPRLGRTVFSEDAWARLSSVLALSARESEILKAVFEDQKESCIAANLRISSHTVHTHIERIYRKLRVSSRVELVVRVFAEYLSKHSP